MGISEWRVANGEWKGAKRAPSPFAIRYSLFALSVCCWMGDAIRAPRTKCPGRCCALRVRWWSKETAARAVRPAAAPVGAVGRGLRLGVRNDLGAGRRGPDHAGDDRLAHEDVIAVGTRAYMARGQHETVALAAAPFARGIAMAAAGNPGLVRVDGNREKHVNGERQNEEADDGRPEFSTRHRNFSYLLLTIRYWRRNTRRVRSALPPMPLRSGGLQARRRVG